tara:strand:- start:765 stop:944 length:180 start_codon:yes stop_codon:yes gene_type:complete
MANREKEIADIKKMTNYIQSTLEYRMGENIFDLIGEDIEAKGLVSPIHGHKYKYKDKVK